VINKVIHVIKDGIKGDIVAFAELCNVEEGLKEGRRLLNDSPVFRSKKKFRTGLIWRHKLKAGIFSLKTAVKHSIPRVLPSSVAKLNSIARTSLKFMV
jgi:hypothetical protein